MTWWGRPALALAILGVGAGAARAQHVERLDSLRAAFGLDPGPARAAAGFSDAGWALRAQEAAAGALPVSGALTVLLIPALFSDSPDPATAPDFLQQLFFEGAPPLGALRDFFAEASGGRLAASGTAAPWYRTAVSLADGTGGSGTALGIGPEFGAYLLEALAAADQVLDFGQFDNDGPDGLPNSGDDNGTVDAVTFLFHETARSCGGPGVWPHKSGVAGYNNGQPWASNDQAPGGTPVTVDGYVIISASECDGTPMATVSVVAHELGHELRLPDLYHPVGQGLDAILSINRRWVVGCFGLMAGGAWGCGPADRFPSFGPTHFSPWSRAQLGWIDLRVVGDVVLEEFVLEPVQASQQVLEIPLDRDGSESLMIEYRPQAGFDGELPASGVIIYRYNRDGALRPDPLGPPTYLFSLLEADADSTLLRTHGQGGNRGEAEDVFVRGGMVSSLSNVTAPSTRRADGTPSSVTIHLIEIGDDDLARILVSTVDTPVVPDVADLGTVAALSPVQAGFTVTGGAQPYGAELDASTAPRGISVAVSGDRLTIDGTAMQTGQFGVRVRIDDVRGVPGTAVFPIVVLPVVVSHDDLLAALVAGGGSVSADLRTLLDNDGNRNGALDVGDVRAYVTRD